MLSLLTRRYPTVFLPSIMANRRPHFLFLFAFLSCKSGTVIVQEQAKPEIKTYEDFLRANRHQQISVTERDRFRDCAENSGSIEPLVMAQGFPYFSYSKQIAGIEQFRTEVNGWPIITSLKHNDHSVEGYPVLLALRGETAAFHKSYFTKPLLSFSELCKNCRLIMSDEFVYHEAPDSREKLLTPLCHRRRYKNQYIGPETPAFQHGGARDYLTRIVPAGTPVIIVSYSNATSPRAEFISREPIGMQTRAEKNSADIEIALRNYITTTRSNFPRDRELLGFIDIEGNFETGTPLLNLLAFLLTEVETNAQMFYYAAVRVEKSDAFPVQVAMIRALRLTGKETDEGVIRYANQKQNILIDVIETPYAPHYANAGFDLRKDTSFVPHKGKNIKRQGVSHLQMPEWVLTRIKHEPKIMKLFGTRHGPI